MKVDWWKVLPWFLTIATVAGLVIYIYTKGHDDGSLEKTAEQQQQKIVVDKELIDDQAKLRQTIERRTDADLQRALAHWVRD